MNSLRPALGFLARFLLVFVLLAAPWPGLHEGYAAVFCGAGNLLFGRFGSDGRVRFRPKPQADRKSDMELELRNRSNDAEYVIEGSARLQGYKPTAYVVALILASPVRWSRRFRAVLWGLLGVNVYAT